MARREELLRQCETLGLTPEKSRNRVDKNTNQHYKESTIADAEKAIQNYYVNEYKREGTLSPFMNNILVLQQPMLATPLKKVKKDIQDIVWEDNSNYIFQEKIDGCRCILCYDKRYGFDFYSRNKSVKDCLPISYRTKLLVPELNKDILDRYSIDNFMIDTELVPMYKNINPMVNGVELVADTQLSLVTSILGSLDNLSHQMQKTNPLKFMAFDLISYNDRWLVNDPLLKRDESLTFILRVLNSAGFEGRIEKVKTTVNNKHAFYENILSNNGEGVVAKDINSLYIGHRGLEWLKIKRTVSQSILMEKEGDTVDAFVSGFKEGNKGTAYEGLIGALEFSVYLTDDNDNYILDENGNATPYVIATVSGLSDELRNIISIKDAYGRVSINPNFLGRVAIVDGQDISSRNMRLTNAIFKGWRPDRNAESCKFRKSELDKLVM